MQEDGPFDGVIPEDYPTTYRKLLNSRCIKLEEGVDCIIITKIEKVISCEACFQTPPIKQSEAVKIENLHAIAWIPTKPIHCEICKKKLTTAESVIKCGICTEKAMSKLN